MSPASPEFGRLLVALFEVCGSPPPLLDVMGNTKTVSGWKNGTHVPRPDVLDAALARMRPRVGHAAWPRERAERFDRIARQLRLMRLVEAAVDHPSWTWEVTAPLRAHLETEIGRFPARQKGSPSPHRALAVVHARLAPMDTAGRRRSALSTVLDLVLPDSDDLSAVDTQEVRELARLLREATRVSPEEAAETLTAASLQLARRPNSVSADFTAYVSDVLGDMLGAFGPTARKNLLLALVDGDTALACRAVKVYGLLADLTMARPPVWFRRLGHDLRLDPRVRTEVNSRLRIHARVRCGGPWPELMDCA